MIYHKEMFCFRNKEEATKGYIEYETDYPLPAGINE